MFFLSRVAQKIATIILIAIEPNPKIDDLALSNLNEFSPSANKVESEV